MELIISKSHFIYFGTNIARKFALTSTSIIYSSLRVKTLTEYWNYFETKEIRNIYICLQAGLEFKTAVKNNTYY
jgi:hypothetical protein